VHLQPIIDVANGAVVAAEALARFTDSAAPPADILSRAHAAGQGIDLELACVRAALAARHRVPEGVLLSINVSPDAIAHPTDTAPWPDRLDGLIIEVTEHASSEPEVLDARLAALRERGARIAVDDVSTGYAGLLRLATLRPEYVKVDRRVIEGVRKSDAHAAVLEALVALAHRIGAVVIAEGVERLEDLRTLADFDADWAQGYAVGAPQPALAPVPDEVVQTCLAGRRRLLRQAATSGLWAARTRENMHGVTATLARAVAQADLFAAFERAGTELDVDVVAASILGYDETLHEVASAGEAVDRTTYRLGDFPATRAALEAGDLLEVHVDDPGSDPAERQVLHRLGHASLLLVPLIAAGEPIGILELAHRTHRRWTSHDVAHARGLAEHVSNAIMRIGAAR
jgi:EAL domain-containing protein (putative c-di-GMP-specific phosphodiesterase class I)